MSNTPLDSASQQKELQHMLFNKRAFGLDKNNKIIDGNSLKRKAKSSQLTQSEWKDRVNVLLHWGPDNLEVLDDKSKKSYCSFRSQNRKGYEWKTKFEVGTSTTTSGKTLYNLYRKSENNEPNRLAVSQLQTFDAIDSAHESVGHFKSSITWKNVKEKYSNITFQLVKLFIDLCPVCATQNPTIKPSKGARKPIYSNKYQDCFQIDLIDMRARRRDDIYGISMQWLMNTKDHTTGLCHLCALPRKRPKYVAHELSKLFGFVGYPNIFHTDNGNEFTANDILDLLKKFNSAIVTVTGRPRTPRDQGSVENSNRWVKTVLSNVEEEARIKGENDNWTALLGRVMSAMNKQVGKGANKASAYDAVFGMPYDIKILCSHKDLFKCKSVGDRIALVPTDIAFKDMASQFCEMSDLSDVQASNSSILSSLDGVKRTLDFKREEEQLYWESS